MRDTHGSSNIQKVSQIIPFLFLQNTRQKFIHSTLRHRISLQTEIIHPSHKTISSKPCKTTMKDEILLSNIKIDSSSTLLVKWINPMPVNPQVWGFNHRKICFQFHKLYFYYISSCRNTKQEAILNSALKRSHQSLQC